MYLNMFFQILESKANCILNAYFQLADRQRLVIMDQVFKHANPVTLIEIHETAYTRKGYKVVFCTFTGKS